MIENDVWSVRLSIPPDAPLSDLDPEEELVRCGIISGVDDLQTARTVLEDYCGEGPIALPELEESLRRSLSLSKSAAVELARAALREFLSAGRIRIHSERALDTELPETTVQEARNLIEDRAAYKYGDGDETRAWFSLDC